MTDEPNDLPEPSDHHRVALFAGGGSAGHVFPGLAVAEDLAARGWLVIWTGRPRGMERELVARAGIAYEALSAAPLVGQGVFGKLRSLATLSVSAWRGWRLVRRVRASVVVGTGGYVSAPAVLGARLARRPSLLIEPNTRAGAANRFLSHWASGAAVAFAETQSDFACPAALTGTPVRQGFFVHRERATEGALRLLILGGSQGARQINELVPPALEALGRAVPGLRVRHQTGAAHAEAVRADYGSRDLGDTKVEVAAFLEDMPSALGEAHLVVSRAGAITLAEICAAGCPSILVPLRQAGDHQFDNARRLQSAGGALVLADEAASVAGLTAAFSDLLQDRDQLRVMGTAASSLAVSDATARIAQMVASLGEAA